MSNSPQKKQKKNCQIPKKEKKLKKKFAPDSPVKWSFRSCFLMFYFSHNFSLTNISSCMVALLFLSKHSIGAMKYPSVPKIGDLMDQIEKKGAQLSGCVFASQ